MVVIDRTKVAEWQSSCAEPPINSEKFPRTGIVTGGTAHPVTGDAPLRPVREMAVPGSKGTKVLRVTVSVFTWEGSALLCHMKRLL